LRLVVHLLQEGAHLIISGVGLSRAGVQEICGEAFHVANMAAGLENSYKCSPAALHSAFAPRFVPDQPVASTGVVVRY